MGSSNLTKNVCKDGKTPKIRGTKKMRLYMAYYMEVLRISKGFREIGWRLRKSVVWLSPLKMKKRCCRRIYRSRSGSFPSQYAGVAQLVEQLIRKNQVCDSKSEYANVAQSVEQLIRNQQVVCSSHIISSKSTGHFGCRRRFSLRHRPFQFFWPLKIHRKNKRYFRGLGWFELPTSPVIPQKQPVPFLNWKRAQAI